MVENPGARRVESARRDGREFAALSEAHRGGYWAAVRALEFFLTLEFAAVTVRTLAGFRLEKSST
jgi:hypothetical protein